MPKQKKQIAHLNNLNRIRYQEKIYQTEPDRNIASEDANVAESSINIIPNKEPEHSTDISVEPENPSTLDIIKDSVTISESINIVDADISKNANTFSISELNTENLNIARLQKKRAELIDLIKFLPDNEIIPACHLFETMTYSGGKREGQIFSPYLINKAKTFIVETLNKQKFSITEMQRKITSLKRENRILQQEKENTNYRVRSLTMKVVKGKETKARYINKIRSIQKSRKVSSEQFKKEAEKLIKVNKKEYTPEFIQLVTELSNTGVISISSTAECTKIIQAFLTGKEPEKCISKNTISRWNKEMARLRVCESLNVDKGSRFFTYGLMADESTRGERKIFLVCFAYWNNKKEQPTLTLATMEDIDRCTGVEVANRVYQTCKDYKFDPAKCNFWLTDNAAYMSGLKSGAVTAFNLRSQANAFRIPCGIHSVHIAITKFENEAFGKLNPSVGSLSMKHPSNLLNLAYQLHDGYKDNDRDTPMNIRSDIIRNLYWTLLEYRLQQYQRPISTRWQYQLKTGEQYLERKKIHLQFAN
jgi:hypothetical protein